MKLQIRFIALLLIAVLSLGLVSCGSDSDTPSGMQLAVCEGAEYRLYIPTTWTVNTNSGISGGYFTQSEYTLVTVTTATAAEGDTVVERWNESEESYKALYPDFALVSDSDTTLGEASAHAYIYTLTYSDTVCKFLEIICLRDGSFYTVLFCFTADNYDDYEDDRSDIISNFKFAEAYTSSDAYVIPTDVAVTAGMKMASFDKGAYRLFVPDTWTLYTRDGLTMAYVSETDRTNVGMTAFMPDDDGMSIKEYWELCKKDYAEDLTDFTEVETLIYDSETDTEWNLHMGGRLTDRFVFTATVDGVTYKYCQYICAYASMFYILTYSAEASNYDAHLSELELIMNNVQIGY